MEDDLPPPPPLFLYPSILRQIEAVEEERMLNARCIAAGLPPFPSSAVPHHHYFLGGYHPPQLEPEQVGLELALGMGMGFTVEDSATAVASDENKHQKHTLPSPVPLPLDFVKLKAPKIEVEDRAFQLGADRVEEGPHLPGNRLSPGIHRLPGLQSLESDPDLDSIPPSKLLCLADVAEPVTWNTPRFHSPSYSPDPEPLAYFLPPPLTWNPSPTTPTPSRPAAPHNTVNTAARRRRKGISDRTKVLAGLMPWERKMDTATLLEEARKYVKFLEAQVTALKYMPEASYFIPSSVSSAVDPLLAALAGGSGGLGRLTRQQLLRVVVNSALVQDRLSSRGLCVYSLEQMVLMRRIMERKMLAQGQQWGQEVQREEEGVQVSSTSVCS